MTHDPRLSEVSPAELAEAFIAAMGWSEGPWTIEVVIDDGRIRKLRATRSFGRNALLERRRSTLEA